MKNLRIAIVTLLALFIGTVLTMATEPKLKMPPELKKTGLDLGYHAKPFQGFGDVEKWQDLGTDDTCNCVDCKCNLTPAVSSPNLAMTAPATVTRYRTEMRPTGRMVQQCNGNTCSMVPEMVPVSVPYEVASDAPEVTQNTTTLRMTPMVYTEPMDYLAPMVNQNGLLLNSNGRQRLFQPLRRWRLRFNTGKLFPNAWWNR